MAKKRRRTPKGRFDRPLFGFYLSIRWLLRHLPHFVKVALVRGLGFVAYHLDRSHRAVIETNLDFLLGDKLTPQRQKEISRQLYIRFLRYLFDVIEHEYRSPDELKAIVRVENDQALRVALDRGERVIILAAHYGHWELVGQYLCSFYRTFVGIAQHFSHSPSLTRELQAYRERAGMEILPRKGAMRKIALSLKAGKMVGFLPDQATKVGKKVPFFGRKISWLESASRLARQFDAVIFPTYITTDDFESYTLFFGDPIRPDLQVEKEADIDRMARLEALSLQKAIERNPEEYFWFHKRLKHDYPGIYEGRVPNPSSKSASS